MDTWTLLDIGQDIRLLTVFYLYMCIHISAASTLDRWLGLTTAGTLTLNCIMQRPIDIPLPRQTSFSPSLDSPPFVGSPSQLSESIDNLNSTTPLSRRPAAHPSGSQLNRRYSEQAQQWSLFGQLMENEGQLPSSMSAPIHSRHEGRADSPGLSPRIRPSDSFHTQPTSYDASFPVHSITSELASNPNNHETDSLSSSAATSTRVLSGATHPYIPFRLPTFTIIHRNVLKCAIAYFVASLFTFSPHLSRFISDSSSYGPNNSTPSPTGHMVATM